ncbi:EAL and HDOD domain-containing protein [Paucidesulfovibrio longus]|uniref:EAL and HDOD domain-containing protein n=1 Tax=Paucidesulfovibrio longus TaxID=889 RepID=UPI0003B5DD66|nr:HDOD domain-containing protein [Paucidesulfovibrio longus]
MKKAKIATGYEDIFVARQPIFSRKRSIVGYELLFRNSGTAGRASFPDEDVASSKVLVDGMVLASANLPDDKRFFINFTRNMLLNDTALTLPPKRCVVEILEHVRPDEDVLEACKRLRKLGYTLALDDYAGNPERDAFLGIADIVKVDVRQLDREMWGQVLDRLKDFGSKVVAEKVEAWSEFEQLMSLGYDYFQGFFFSRPEMLPGRRLSSGMLAKVRLLKVLGDPNARPQEIPDVIASDPGLTLRLLKFINSAAFGFRSQITSIQHAVTLLGVQPLRRWAMIVVISDMDDSFKGEELTYISLQRARFLECLAEAAPAPPLTPGGLFLLGLLSRVDAMLGLPMQEVLGDLVLEDELTQALKGLDCPAKHWLGMIEALERGDWRSASASVAGWGLSGSQAARCHLASSSWASEKIWALRHH